MSNDTGSNFLEFSKNFTILGLEARLKLYDEKLLEAKKRCFIVLVAPKNVIKTWPASCCAKAESVHAAASN
jgi:hypothetical protein